MHIKPMNLALCLILLCGLLAACGGAPPTSSAGEVETIVAATMQALTTQASNTQPAEPAAEVPTPTLLPTAIPAVVASQGSFIPYAADPCEYMRSNFEQAIGAPVTVEAAPFSDRVTGGTGTACRIQASGDGAKYGIAGPFNTLYTLVLSLGGWTEDINYGAGGATGMADGFRNGSVLGLLTVSWEPSADANCPSNQPIGACELTPEQKLFEVTFDLAQVVVFIPPSSDQCTAWLTAFQPSVPVRLVLETVEFNDLGGNAGTACQIRGAGNGLDFNNFSDTASILGDVLVSLGWMQSNGGADGPTGTVREYSKQNQTALVTVVWEPSADANCPTDQPISSCVLAPEQKLYTLTVAFAQR